MKLSALIGLKRKINSRDAMAGGRIAGREDPSADTQAGWCNEVTLIQ